MNILEYAEATQAEGAVRRAFGRRRTPRRHARAQAFEYPSRPRRPTHPSL